ncbi:hypothetical protein BpHYR1_023212 [Brachionus plicatilis]|uniref:Uncharacterized protein n=1 Tax=Brachionus plicatilis TaxID=10195 RepID=A0A3M7PUB1_BRAPC|nr:hypothetical protein BpHYR1_023212 [Brachionus plicatilis]
MTSSEQIGLEVKQIRPKWWAKQARLGGRLFIEWLNVVVLIQITASGKVGPISHRYLPNHSVE